MFIKIHEPNPYYQYLLAVEGRIMLHDNDAINLYRYKRGEAGEHQFYAQLKDIMEGIKLWDITLESQGQSQYDFLIVVNRKIYHFDVKNFSGEYTYKNDNFISANGRNYKNVLAQLNAAHDRLERIVKQQEWHYEVESRILFMNDQFSIRNYDGNPMIWFSHQLPQFIEQLKKETTYKNDLYIAEQLLSLHQPKQFERIFYYPFEQLKVGPRCPVCREIDSITVLNKFKHVHCKCGHVYFKSEMLQQIAYDIHLMNNGRITAKDVCRWSGVPERSVRDFLVKNYNKYGTFKDAYYTLR
ncbi:nuclease-related domain-containing protein [Macrococcus capreoli]|uniref:nuclease-related domain-containing protein n=1 Tax=Macrococcus capreoli TaxID=2982690 RepID=UPI003EE5E05C